MKLYQKLIIPALSLALAAFPSCQKNKQAARQARISEPTAKFQGVYPRDPQSPLEPTILTIQYNTPGLECTINGEPIITRAPFGEFSLGSYSNIPGQGIHTLSLAVRDTCTLEVIASPALYDPRSAQQVISGTLTLQYTGNPYITSDEITKMAKEALTGSKGGGGWTDAIAEIPGRLWGGIRNHILGSPGDSSTAQGQSLQDYLNSVNKRAERRTQREGMGTGAAGTQSFSMERYLEPLRKRKERRY